MKNMRKILQKIYKTHGKLLQTTKKTHRGRRWKKMDYNFNFQHPTIKKLHCIKIRNNKPKVLFQGLPKDVRPIRDALQTTPFKYRNLILVGRMSNCSPPFETDSLGKSDNSVVLYDVITVLLENISNNLCLPVYIFGVLLRGVG